MVFTILQNEAIHVNRTLFRSKEAVFITLVTVVSSITRTAPTTVSIDTVITCTPMLARLR